MEFYPNCPLCRHKIIMGMDLCEAGRWKLLRQGIQGSAQRDRVQWRARVRDLYSAIKLAEVKLRPFPSEYYTIVSSLPDSVLLESSLPDQDNWQSYLFAEPERILAAETPDDLPGLFKRIEDCLGTGFFVAGFMSYECGYHFEPCTATRPFERYRSPLAWFGVYKQPLIFDHMTGILHPELPREWRGLVHSMTELANPPISGCHLEMTRDDYCAKVEAVREYIAAGDTYQVNLTTKASFEYSGSPAALFSALRNQQKVPYAAFIHLKNRDILSFSPELFFRIKDGRITTRPMKGTAPRGRTLMEDTELRNWLRGDPKNRSENVMIVDLLRNDIGRIAEVGTVRVDELFATEKYETLFQMTSTVSGTLHPGIKLHDIFRAIFPSGSVTGAPKCRTMQIIQQLEHAPRGVYAGAIGYFSPGRNYDAVFSVPIRTIILRTGSGEMGVGSGIVFDSVPLQEYEEVLLKTEFLTQERTSFQLLESLRWDGQYHFLDQHLKRLKSSSEYFAFPFNESKVRAVLAENQSSLHAGHMYKVRLLLGPAGEVLIENAPLDPEPAQGTITLSPAKTCSKDRLLYHKTTSRDVYERMHAEARQQGHVDVIFMNERGELTEGAHNNLFVKIAGQLLTPPVDCGLLPGVYRRHILESDPRALERIITVEDLKAAEAIYLCNSIRGLRQVRLLEAAHGDSLSQQVGVLMEADKGRIQSAIAGPKLAAAPSRRAR